MTALDPTPIVAELREEHRLLGEYREGTVERLLTVLEATGELALPSAVAVPDAYLPAPRGGRSTWPRPRTRLTNLVALRPGCGSIAPDGGPGSLRYACTEPRGHEPEDHVARSSDGRELRRWPVGSGGGS